MNGLENDFGNPEIAGIHEIALPEPVPYTPQTLGWYLLLALLLALTVWWLIRRQRSRKANRYRSEALAELAQLERALAGSDRGEALAGLPALVKRTTLAFSHRREVAGRVGEPWLAYLDETLGGDDFSRGPGKLLADLAYRSPAKLAAVPDAEAAALFGVVRHWIQHHRAA